MAGTLSLACPPAPVTAPPPPRIPQHPPTNITYINCLLTFVYIAECKHQSLAVTAHRSLHRFPYLEASSEKLQTLSRKAPDPAAACNRRAPETISVAHASMPRHPPCVGSVPTIDIAAEIVAQTAAPTQTFSILECAAYRPVLPDPPSHAILRRRCRHIVRRRTKVIAPAVAAAQRVRYGPQPPSDLSRVLFHVGKPREDAPGARLARMNVPYIFDPDTNEMESSRELSMGAGDVIANEYEIHSPIGKGSFSTVFYAKSKTDARPVSVKILRNDKETFDAGLGEVRILAMIAKADPDNERALLRLLDFFYYREHLFIITELQHATLLAHYSRLSQNGGTPTAPRRVLNLLSHAAVCLRSPYQWLGPLPHPHPCSGGHERLSFYNAATVGKMAWQVLDALQLLHELGVTHCDIKTDNICVADRGGTSFKLIDFGSATFAHDTHPSYLQTRWYRAPEVMVGDKWNSKIDVWGVGCCVAELLLGCPAFMFDSIALVLAAQRAMRGPFPVRMLACPLAPMYMTTAGVPYEVDPKGSPKGVYFVESLPDSSLRAVLTRQMAPGQEAFGVSHVNRCISFVESLLTLDPEERPTAAAALHSPFLERFADAQCADLASSSFTSVLDAASVLDAMSERDVASVIDASTL